jgi:hypothetical protein
MATIIPMQTNIIAIAVPAGIVPPTVPFIEHATKIATITKRNANVPLITLIAFISNSFLGYLERLQYNLLR